MSKWYSKIKVGLPSTPRLFKSSLKDGEDRCIYCKKAFQIAELEKNLFVCSCGFHFRIGSLEYFTLLFDNSSFTELFPNIVSNDVLGFTDTVSYKEKLIQARERTELNEAYNVATGQINSLEVLLGVMDFPFIGGSISMAVGEKIIRSFDHCIKHRLPLILITRSGGTRLMEGNYAMMQMVKIAAKMNEFAEARLPYISVLSDPTIGAATSMAMQADFILAEPNSLIGYASPKVILDSIGRDLPKGFQQSEFVQEHGFIDIICQRKDLKIRLTELLNLLKE